MRRGSQLPVPYKYAEILQKYFPYVGVTEQVYTNGNLELLQLSNEVWEVNVDMQDVVNKLSEEILMTGDPNSEVIPAPTYHQVEFYLRSQDKWLLELKLQADGDYLATTSDEDFQYRDAFKAVTMSNSKKLVEINLDFISKLSK